MSIDLGGIFETVEAVVLGLLATGGTTVDVLRDPTPGAAAVDPTTLVVAEAAYEAIATGVDALLSPSGAGEPLSLPAPVAARPGDYRVVLEPSIVDVADGDLIRVMTCRDPRLVGREFLAREFSDSSAGAVRMIVAAPVLASARQAQA